VAWVSVCLVIWVAGTGQVPAVSQRWGPKYAKPFVLIDHRGHSFTNNRFIGKWSLVFFGYTHCPDVCPLSLAVLKDVHRLVREGGVSQQRLQYIFVSVDPDRDTPAQLADYVKYFGGFLLGVTGKTDEIEKLVIACGAHYEFNDPDEKGDYTISHTASIALVDPQGTLAGVFPEPLEAKSISKALVDLVK